MRTEYVTILAATMFCLSLWACGNDQAPKDAEQPAVELTGNPVIDGISEKIAVDPANADLYAERAAAYYDNDGFDEAIRDMKQALFIDSTNVDHHHLLADIYLDYFKSHLALSTMERAAALYPERIPTLLKLSEFQLILKQYDASMRTIDKILKLDPQNAEAYFMFGMNFKEMGDLERAINSFQTAVEIDPDLVDAWINLGALHAQLGNAIAAQYYDNALRAAPDNVVVIHAKADYLRDQDQLQEAIKLYKRINVIDPQYETGYYNAGLLYMELDSVQEAYRLFDLAIKTSPTHIRAYFYRGLASEMMGNVSQAIHDYQQALNLAPGYERAQQALARLQESVAE